jgi:prolyl 4-hydroxylase
MLSKEWNEWLIINAARGCSRENLLSDLTIKGGYALDVAEKAFEGVWDDLARCTNISKIIKGESIRPDIESTHNSLKVDDRFISILMTCEKPRIVFLDNVLTETECDELIALAEERIQRSQVVDASSGNSTPHGARTSHGAFFKRQESDLITAIEKRLAQITHWPIEYGEGLQVMRYEIGEEYKTHYDWFDPSKTGSSKHLSQGGQRVGTVVMYLSDVEQGGGTLFPHLGLEVRPKKGAAVFFANVTENGIPDKQTWHAGAPVISGVKYIATKWMRESTNQSS